VLTHLARNADGLRNLLIWARTGIELLAWLTGRDDGPDGQRRAGRPRPGAGHRP